MVSKQPGQAFHGCLGCRGCTGSYASARITPGKPCQVGAATLAGPPRLLINLPKQLVIDRYQYFSHGPIISGYHGVRTGSCTAGGPPRRRLRPPCGPRPVRDLPADTSWLTATHTSSRRAYNHPRRKREVQEATLLRIVIRRLEDGPGCLAMCPRLQGRHADVRALRRPGTTCAAWQKWLRALRREDRLPLPPTTLRTAEVVDGQFAVTIG